MEGLHRLNWETNDICNEDCAFCFASFRLPNRLDVPGSERRDFAFQLTTEEAKDLITAAVRVGAKEFLFGGGDPFIRSDMSTLVRYAHESGLRTVVDTNCLVLGARPNLFSDVAPYISRIGIPFDGPDPKTNDAMRDKHGAFNRQMTVLQASQSQAFEVKINTIVTRKNLARIPLIADLFRDMRVTTWSLDQFVPQARGLLHREKYEISDDEYDALIVAVRERLLALNLPIPLSGGKYSQKEGTVLIFGPQGVAYVPHGTDKKYIGSIRAMSLDEIIHAARNFDIAKHQARFA